MIEIFLDTETNGLNPHKHSILELAYKILDVKTGELVGEYQSVIAQSKELFDRASQSSFQINGFTWELVQRGRPPNEVQEGVIASFGKAGVKRGKAVFICQNPSFDRAFFSQLIDPDKQEELDWPYHWLDLASMYWAVHMRKAPLPWETGVSKDKISEVYSLAPETKPHRAMNGVNHLIACYEAVVGFSSQISV